MEEKSMENMKKINLVKALQKAVVAFYESMEADGYSVQGDRENALIVGENASPVGVNIGHINITWKIR